MIEKDLLTTNMKSCSASATRTTLSQISAPRNTQSCLRCALIPAWRARFPCWEDDVGHNNRDSRIRFVFVDGRLSSKGFR